MAKDFPVSVEVYHGQVFRSDGPMRQVAYVPIYEDDLSVEAAMEYAFHATNTINHSWYEGTTAITVVEGPLRSTSVGDYMRILWMERPPAWYRVDRIGFTEVENPFKKR